MIRAFIITILGIFPILFGGAFNVGDETLTGVWVARNPPGIGHPYLHPSEFIYDTLILKRHKFTWKVSHINIANTKLSEGRYATKGDTLTLYIEIERTLFVEETGKYINNDNIKGKFVKLIINKSGIEDFFLQFHDKVFERIDR